MDYYYFHPLSLLANIPFIDLELIYKYFYFYPYLIVYHSQYELVTTTYINRNRFAEACAIMQFSIDLV